MSATTLDCASDFDPETEVAALQVVLNDSRKELEKVKMQ